jgi:hypothetical protein
MRPRKAALALAAIVIAAAAAEMFLRYGLGLGKPVLVQADPGAGYILKPDQDLHRFFGRVHINHQGMRSPEIAPVRDPRALRVMFVGDSFTYGAGRVSQEDLFTDIVRRELPRVVGRPVEVLNASASDWAPANEVGFVRRYGTFGSDLVVLVLNNEDLAQPVAKIEDAQDDLMQTNPPSAFAELYTRFIRPRLRPRPGPGPRAISGADGVVRENLTALDSLHAQLQSLGARLVVLFLPVRAQIPGGSAGALATLKAWTDQRGVKLLDFTPLEAAYPAGAITLDGAHFSAKGNRVVADALLRDWPG